MFLACMCVGPGENRKFFSPGQGRGAIALTGRVMCLYSFVPESETANTKGSGARCSENMGESEECEEQAHGFEYDRDHLVQS